MSLSFFIAHRLYCEKKEGRQISRPAVLIAKTGIAVGLAVMLVAVCVIVGFKSEVRDKIVGFGGHVQINNLEQMQPYEPLAIGIDDTLINSLAAFPNVKHIQRYSVKPGMIKTEKAFQGMVLKGVGKEYDLTYISQHVIDGEIPLFTDTAATNKVMLSKSMADKLKLKAGDKIYTYYVDDNVRARRLTVSAIYQTNFSAFDDYFLITDIYTVNRLNKWEPDQVSGVEIDVDDYSRIDEVNDNLRSSLFESSDKYGQSYFSRTIVEANPQIFAWLDLLDLNVWVILILMTGVAGFTMISGLLIIILERTNMIGVLKSMGADNNSIRKIFLSFSVFLIGRGMLWGNIIGLSLCLIQYFFEPVKLDPSVYYVNSVPIELNVFIYILLNVFTLVVSVLMLVGPSYLISRIHPARSIRYE